MHFFFLTANSEGRDVFPRRMYANPENPKACTVLMTALYVLVSPTFRSANGSRSDAASPLFCIGQDADKRFQSWLASVLRKMEARLRERGYINDVKNIGTLFL